MITLSLSRGIDRNLERENEFRDAGEAESKGGQRLFQEGFQIRRTLLQEGMVQGQEHSKITPFF